MIQRGRETKYLFHNILAKTMVVVWVVSTLRILSYCLIKTPFRRKCLFWSLEHFWKYLTISIRQWISKTNAIYYNIGYVIPQEKQLLFKLTPDTDHCPWGWTPSVKCMSIFYICHKSIIQIIDPEDRSRWSIQIVIKNFYLGGKKNLANFTIFFMRLFKSYSLRAYPPNRELQVCLVFCF